MGWFEVKIRVQVGDEGELIPVSAQEVEEAVQQIIDAAGPEDVNGREVEIRDSCACRARPCKDERGNE